MEMLSHLRQLYDFEDWATKRILDALAELEQPPQLALEQLGHSLGGRLAWLTRLAQGHSADVDIWPLLDVDGLRELHVETMGGLRAVLDGLDEAQLAEPIAYRSYEGTTEQRRLFDVLYHVVNHAVQHRGTILRSIREAGGSAPESDWIIYVRGL